MLSRQEDVRLIQNDILQLLLTIPGERVMRPDFGINLRSFVFEQMIGSEISLLESEIVSAIEEQDRRVTVSFIEIKQSPESNRVDISVHAKLKKNPTKVVTVELFLENPVGA